MAGIHNIIVTLLVSGLVCGSKPFPKIQFLGRDLANNSFVYYKEITISYPLKCVTDNGECCNGSDVGNWIDGRGTEVYQGAEGATCLYVTRGPGEIILNRNTSCRPQSVGMWRCDIPDSSDEMQSLYIYIGNSLTTGKLSESVFVKFILHTEPNSSVPEFTVSCETQGGPATTVEWAVDDTPIQEDIDHETSQIILDTDRSVFENSLRVRGRKSGTYNCFITNNFKDFFPTHNDAPAANASQNIYAAGQPINFTAIILETNSTHVNITLSWMLPADSVMTTGYMIYYHPMEGPVINHKIASGELRNLSLNGLRRALFHNFSIVALSNKLPSVLVGYTLIPDPLLWVSTSPPLHTTLPGNNFSLSCTVRAEHNGHHLNTTIQWLRIAANESVIVQTRNFTEQILVPANSSTSTSPADIGYLSLLIATEVDTVESVTYRCRATTVNDSSFSDITVLIDNHILPGSSVVGYTLIPDRDSINATSLIIKTAVVEQEIETTTPIIMIMVTTTATFTTTTTVIPISTFLLSTSHTAVITCVSTKDEKKNSCVDSTVVLVGAVGGGVCLIIGNLVLVIVLFLICKRPNSAKYGKKVVIQSNTAYGVIRVRREDPEYEVIRPAVSQPGPASAISGL